MNEKKRFYVYWSLVFAAAMLCVFLLSPQSHAETAAKNEAASGSLIDAIRSSIPETMKEEAREVHEAGRAAQEEKERADLLKKAQDDLPKFDALLAAVYESDKLDKNIKEMIRKEVIRERSSWRNIWDQNRHIVRFVYKIGELAGAEDKDGEKSMFAALSEDLEAQKTLLLLFLAYEDRPAALGPEPWSTRAGVLEIAEDDVPYFNNVLDALYASDQLEKSVKDIIRSRVSEVRASARNMWDQNRYILSYLLILGEGLRDESKAEENVVMTVVSKKPIAEYAMNELLQRYSEERPEVLGPDPDAEQGSAEQPHNGK